MPRPYSACSENHSQFVRLRTIRFAPASHVLDLCQQWHGLLVAQDTASVVIEIRAGVLYLIELLDSGRLWTTDGDRSGRSTIGAAA